MKANWQGGCGESCSRGKEEYCRNLGEHGEHLLQGQSHVCLPDKYRYILLARSYLSCRFLICIENGYRNHPYHNRLARLRSSSLSYASLLHCLYCLHDCIITISKLPHTCARHQYNPHRL